MEVLSNLRGERLNLLFLEELGLLLEQGFQVERAQIEGEALCCSL